MTHRTRRFLFYANVIVFLVLGTGVVFYARGWRLDPWSLSINKVGAIYVRSYPAKANISLNGLPIQNRSWFFQNGTLINNLFPKRYELRLEHDGYKPWHVHLNVQPSLVTEVKLGVLVPENAISHTDSIQRLWMLNGTPVILNNRQSLIWGEHAFKGNQFLEGTNDASRVLTYDSTRGDYFLTDLRTNTTTVVHTLLEQLRIPVRNSIPILDQSDRNQLLVKNPPSLFLVDLNRSTTRTLIATPRAGISASSTFFGELAASRAYYAWSLFDQKTGTSRIVFYNTLLNSTQTTPPFPGKTTKLSWTGGSRLGILQDDNNFYIGRPSDTTPDKIASDVRDFEFTDDGSQVVTLEHRSLEIFSLENRDEGYWRFNIPNPENVIKARWYRDNHHLFLLYPEEVRFLDLNDSNLENLTLVTNGWDMDYNPSLNLLYVLQGSTLLQFEFAR